jgi:hypothetical protein
MCELDGERRLVVVMSAHPNWCKMQSTAIPRVDGRLAAPTSGAGLDVGVVIRPAYR